MGDILLLFLLVYYSSLCCCPRAGTFSKLMSTDLSGHHPALSDAISWVSSLFHLLRGCLSLPSPSLIPPTPSPFPILNGELLFSSENKRGLRWEWHPPPPLLLNLHLYSHLPTSDDGWSLLSKAAPQWGHRMQLLPPLYQQFLALFWIIPSCLQACYNSSR